VASQYTALCITQDNEPIRILRAERVVQAAGNIEPVIADQFLFHWEPHPRRRQNSTIRASCSTISISTTSRSAARRPTG